MARRIVLPLKEKNDWLRLFDPREFALFIPLADPPDVDSEVRIDLTVGNGGPRLILKGMVLWCRTEADERSPSGASIGLAIDDREKVNFLNGYVRGGLLNRREMRRLPLRLPITYGGLSGPEKAFCRDINEEGIFIVTRDPLAENTRMQLLVTFPTEEEPVRMDGVVSHTVIVEDEDVPGMGIRFLFADAAEKQVFKARIDALEAAFTSGQLPEEVID